MKKFYHAQITSPDLYKRFRYKKHFAKGIDVVWGVRPNGKTEIQSIRFSPKRFNRAKVINWLERNKFKFTKIEEPNPATKKSIDLYKAFHHRDDVKIIKDNLNIPDNELIFIGKAKELSYTSDKRLYDDKKIRDYIHNFKKHGDVMTTKDGRTIIIMNLSTRLKPEGIVG